jgi:transitional endoplasmic reticulum ATPase
VPCYFCLFTFTLLLMSETNLPDWTNELKQRYLRGEASVFVLYGNVYDTILHDGKLLALTDFLVNEVLKTSKDLVGVFNISQGFRVAYRKAYEDGRKDTLNVLGTLTTSHSKTQWLEALEILLTGTNIGTTSRNALILEYTETLAPAGDPSFQADTDRAAVVTLHRWSFLPNIQQQDNIVILLTENLSELSPKIVANPRVAAIEVPLPDAETRKKAIALTDNSMSENSLNRYAEITAGLKLLQITSILTPHQTNGATVEERTNFIAGLLGGGEDVMHRAKELAGLTLEKTNEEIVKLLAPDKKDSADQNARDLQEKAKNERDKLIFQRKREIIERECFGLLEFIEPKFGFEVVGGQEAVKEDLRFIAKNMREGFYNRVPMGLLFTGAQGTGKTFFATAFAGEAKMTAVKLKNIRSKWVGATEGNLEKVLSVIKAIGQVIVIIDEADRSFGNGGESEGDDGTSSRIIAKMKEFMSDTSNRGRVLFILMSNRPDQIDVDLKRAGRIDRKIPFFYPQAEAEVAAIGKAISKKNQLPVDGKMLEKSDIWKQMVGYSAADIEAVLLLAGENAAKISETETIITNENLDAALADYFPSRDTTMLNFMEHLAVFECSNRRLLPEKYADLSAEELQQKLETLRLLVGNRR